MGGERFQTGFQTLRGVRHPSTARTSPLRPSRHRGLGDPIERFLAHTGRANRRRVVRELQMAENLAEHLGLGDGSNNSQRPLTAKRTGGHIQSKHLLQELRPAPARRLCRGIIPLHALLTRRRRDRAAQATVRRQTAPIPHQVDLQQRHQGGQLLQEFHWREGDPSRAV